MSKKILFQSLLKFRDQIKDGTAKVQDVITDYFNQTGKSVTDEERAIILNEFAKDAPSNVEPIDFGQNIKGIYDKAQGPGAGDAMVEALKSPGAKKSKEIMEEALGVKLRGDETFGELMEIKKSLETKNEGIGSLFEKDIDGFDDRREVAEFIRNMRGAGIKNPDIRGVFKEFGTDIKGGKRAATTLARAADMGADTKVKQELLSELDEMKMDKGPRFFQEEFMGYDDFISAVDAKKIEVNNAIVDDLEAMGVADEDVMRIMGQARELNRKPFYISGEEFVDIIKEELEFNDINYNVDFYKNYFRELESLLRKPEPRFMYGGAV
jgi:hypothetical protein